MFRKMRRFKQQVEREECIRVLKEQPRGVLAVLGDDDYPYTVPIDFYYDEEEDRIYFHGAGEGHKMDAIRKHDKVSFCVWNEGFRREGEWALNITSVVIFGRIRVVDEPEKKEEKVRKLGLKYYPTVEGVDEEMKKAFRRVTCLELIPEHMTGKLVNES